MSVWDAIVGQQAAVDQLKTIACGDPKSIAQSWLICGPAGSGRGDVARAFAAALDSPDHGLGDQSTDVTRQILADAHPDVKTLATDKVTISIDDVRELIGLSEQMPSTAPWRIIIIEDVDRMLERTTNVLLKEIEEPSEHTIWLLCAPSAQDVLPTIRSRCRIVNLAVPSAEAIAEHLMRDVLPTVKEETERFDRTIADRAARLSEGNIEAAVLYAKDERVRADRDELVAGVLRLSRASDAILLAGDLNDSAKTQAEAQAGWDVEEKEAEFRRINGLGADERIPTNLRGAYNQIGKKDEVKRRATRLTRDVIGRGLDAVASVYRDVAVLQNDAEPSVGLINIEHRAAIGELAARLDRAATVRRLDDIAVARRRLAGNGNQLLVLEALFCALLP